MQELPLFRAIRSYELERALIRMPHGGHLLELGSGNGWQARLLADRGYEVTALDLPDAISDDRHFPIDAFDGRHIPHPDATFDLVYSSNVLEHVEDLPGLLAESRRVLRSGGTAVHLMPSPAWRFWTSASHFMALPLRRGTGRPSAVLPGPHGRPEDTAMAELWRFARRRWISALQASGFEVLVAEPTRLFYTGNLLARPVGIPWRVRLSRVLGSAGYVYVAVAR